MADNSAIDPQRVIDAGPMRLRQVIAIAVCVLLNALDGFDVLSISFAAPGIAAQWGTDIVTLGAILAMELVGMTVGSILLGPFADRAGRKPTAMLCLVMMSLGMFGAAHAPSIEVLGVFRFLTGVGIGGMLPSVNAMAAEYASAKWRGAAVALVAAGYPLGGVVGGLFAGTLLESGSWRDVFTFGATATLLMLPLLYFLAPESVGYLLQRKPDDLKRINKALAGLGHPTIHRVSAVTSPPSPRLSLARLFESDIRATTLLLTIGYFTHLMTFYFVMKWIPKIVVDMGYAPSSGAGVLVSANVGGLIGSFMLSALAVRFDLRVLMIVALTAAAAMVTYFGQADADLSALTIAAGGAGFFLSAGFVGFYALIAVSFPVDLRAGGTGFVIGIGRGGATLGPFIAGLLFNAGIGLSEVALLLGLGSLVAAVTVLAIRRSSR